MTAFEDRDVPGFDQVEELLEAYADAHLMPRGPVLSRMRSAVMAEAAVAAASRRRALQAAAPRRWYSRPRIQIPRRAFALTMAAALTFGTSAAVLAAPPGSSFYNARLVIQAALLPPPSRAEERLAAYEQHLVERLKEAEAAAASGDARALAAALAAYRAEVDAIVAEGGVDADQLAHLEEVLGKHTAVLEALAAKVPQQAAIEHAIQTSQKAVQKIKDRKNGVQNGGQPTRAPGRPSQQPQPPSGPEQPEQPERPDRN